jgi:hypothetical protein
MRLSEQRFDLGPYSLAKYFFSRRELPVVLQSVSCGYIYHHAFLALIRGDPERAILIEI